MNAKNIKARYVIGALVILPLLFWYVATPVVHVHYSEKGTDELRLIWNTQHNIHKEGMLPGQATFDTGHVFPNSEFFMVFDWWSKKGLQRCIDITPKWGGTIDIYLDESAKIDTARTSPDVIARLKQCAGEPDPFRS
ncbi:hypothetical protein [Pseudomonas cichorii]|uniref:hypothetical protein n=1 Tax=Pseudomonas cichorii TaxID=36746 RepID=UPI001C883D4E|nr:hypothetical protein [Pseudomonas cichorii]MBX8487094.1 hypothetical protein [Pseudomonas cichorii]MBX8516121.1 hypothetical protein [Pseudomonas cichorii]MBX8541712.1 hypothetical protein [Pseudomonas cichorii]MBX8561400.1 hypothetical protein [Pseudomonas cichorii]MBX8567391.1 hypothetical protein [Pseudomonas cichorii]